MDKNLNMLHQADEQGIRLSGPAFSRRGFFSLAAALGLASSAPFWEGFFLRAYADETGEISDPVPGRRRQR